MKQVFSPEGARILVDDIISETSLEQRAERAGLEIVIAQQNRPRNTSGVIVALGPDPFLTEEITVNGYKRPRYMLGDIVFFDWHAGTYQYIQDHEFRSLEVSMITGCQRAIPDSKAQDSLSAEFAQDVQSA